MNYRCETDLAAIKDGMTFREILFKPMAAGLFLQKDTTGGMEKIAGEIDTCPAIALPIWKHGSSGGMF